MPIPKILQHCYTIGSLRLPLQVPLGKQTIVHKQYIIGHHYFCQVELAVRLRNLPSMDLSLNSYTKNPINRHFQIL